MRKRKKHSHNENNKLNCKNFFGLGIILFMLLKFTFVFLAQTSHVGGP